MSDLTNLAGPRGFGGKPKSTGRMYANGAEAPATPALPQMTPDQELAYLREQVAAGYAEKGRRDAQRRAMQSIGYGGVSNPQNPVSGGMPQKKRLRSAVENLEYNPPVQGYQRTSGPANPIEVFRNLKDRTDIVEPYLR